MLNKLFLIENLRKKQSQNQQIDPNKVSKCVGDLTNKNQTLPPPIITYTHVKTAFKYSRGHYVPRYLGV